MQLEGLVDGAVEQHVVVGHVEMAVVVDPVLLDGHHRGDERRKEQRLEIDAIQHGSTRIQDDIMPDFAPKSRKFCINYAI